MSDETVSLKTLKNGAAIEMFDRGFQKLLDDIADLNKVPTSVREINLKVKIVPAEDARYGKYVITVDTKLGKQAEQIGSLSLGYDGRKGVASEHLNVSQPNLLTQNVSESESN